MFKALLIVLGCGLSIASSDELRAQDFRYTPKPPASATPLAYTSPDPAPRMMAASEAVDYANQPPQQGYFYPSYRDSAAAQWSGGSPPRSARPASGFNSASVGEPMVGGMPTDAYYPGQAPGGPIVDPAYQGSVQPVPDPYANGYGPNGEYLAPNENCQPCGPNVGACPYGPLPNEDYEQAWWDRGTSWLKRVDDWVDSTPVASPRIWRYFNEFGGVQGFKGPPDLGMNGNFGFYKGVNWATPLLDSLGIGFQLGGEIVISNLSGSTGLVNSHRDQYFVTSGLFRRARGNRGWQGGAVVDYLHDSYYVSMDLLQIRPEASYIFARGHEVGLWAGVHLTSDTKPNPILFNLVNTTWQATDQYNLFYRKNFEGGGVGRTWIGLSGHGDVMFGSDATIPLAEQWAIQASYNYLLPRQDGDVPSAVRETWGLAMCLVWYPHCKIPNGCVNPYKPLFNVADNSTFLTKTN